MGSGELSVGYKTLGLAAKYYEGTGGTMDGSTDATVHATLMGAYNSYSKYFSMTTTDPFFTSYDANI